MPPPARLPNLLDDTLDEAVDAIPPSAAAAMPGRGPLAPERRRRRRRKGGRPGRPSTGAEAEAAQGAERRGRRGAEHGGAAVRGPNRHHRGSASIDGLAATDASGEIHIRSGRARGGTGGEAVSVEWE